jgi:hypothetical protein
VSRLSVGDRRVRSSAWARCCRHHPRADDVGVLIFEITQDYQILVPLMVANLLSFTISRRFQPVTIYHALLEQDGVHLPPRRP